MKRFNYKTGLTAVVISLAILSPGCKKDFGSTNTDPSIVTSPDVKFLFSYAAEQVAGGHTRELVYESYEQLWRFSQYVSTNPYDMYPDINTRFSHFYSGVLPNLFEIRRQIDAKEDKENYAKMSAVTYVLQVLFGIRVTDMNGSIPYTEAMRARVDGKFDPVYDKQDALFDIWVGELDNAISVLSAANTDKTVSYGNFDIYYKGDWNKWIKLANTLKLRIASRLESQNSAKAGSIVSSVMSNSQGPMSEVEDNLQYSSPNNNGVGGDINYRAAKFAPISMVDFMKKVEDPRLGVYYGTNDLVGSFKDSLTKYNATLPSFIDLNDPYVQYQGGPADWSRNDVPQRNYIITPFVVAPTLSYNLISPINRKFFSPRWNGNDESAYVELLVSSAESCLLVAEMIEKGLATGDASQWYEKGVRNSIKTMNNIAVLAKSKTAYDGDGAAVISAYLNDPLIKLGGTGASDLEKIYIQQFINLMREPNEGYVFVRRTGYPANASSYFAREPFSEAIPRRLWIDETGVQANRANWQAAYQDQGFTPNSHIKEQLSVERVWYDKNAPEFGEGQ